jgi:hypothetical protein
MNVWNRLGDLGKGVFDWTRDIGLAVASPAKFVWDVTTAPWNDREEFNGFLSTFKQSTIDLGKNLGRPLGGVIGAIEATNRNLIREPLSALALAAGTDAGWQKAWDNRNKISVGQAYTNLLGQGLGEILPDELTPKFMDSDFDIYDEKQRNEAFKKSLYGRVLSGSIDTVAQFVGDVSIVGGKAMVAYKAADTAKDTIIALRQVRSGVLDDKVAQRYDALADDFANNDITWALAHPWVKASNNEASVGYLLGITQTKEEAIETMLAVMGDASGIKRLEDISRPDIAAPLRVANGELTRSQLKIVLSEESKIASGLDDDMLPFGTRTPEEITADREYLAAWAKHDKYVDQLFNIAVEAPVSEGIGRFGQSIGKEVATARTVPFHAKEAGEGTITAYQPTPLHKLYYKISWGEKERPGGVVNLNEGDSIREVMAVTDRLVQLSKRKVLSSENELVAKVLEPLQKPISALSRPFLGEGIFTEIQAQSIVERYAGATTPEARARVINDLEAIGYNLLAKKHNISPDNARKMFDYHNQVRTGKLREAKEEGFIWDAEANAMVKVPMFESQTANFLPVADFDKIDDVLYRNGNAISAALGRGHDIIGATSDLWKAAVLLRLGYPIRNAADSQLRIWATVGAMASLRHAGEGARHLRDNLFPEGERLVDKYKTIKKLNYGEIKATLQLTGKEITALEKEIPGLEARLLLDPENPDLIGEIINKKTALRDKRAVYEANNDTLTKIEQSKVPSRKKRIGTEDFQLTSSIPGVDGGDYTVFGAFGGPNGGLFRELNSSQRTFYSLLEDYSTIYGANVASKGRGAIRPEDVNYYQEWSNAINEVFGNSVVARELMSGKSIQDVAKDLADNQQLRARLGLARHETLEYVSNAKRFVDQYVPDGYGLREELLGSSAILKSKFPYLQDYKDGGNGGIPGTRSTVGFVKVSALKDMPGNTLSNFEGIDALRKSIREGKGFATRELDGKPFQDPIMVVYDNETGLAYIGEGNHRLQAAIAEGLDAVPVRVVRGNKEEMVASGGRKPQQIKNDKNPQFPETVGKNIGKVRDPEYVPPTMHPSYVFDKEFIVDENVISSKINEAMLRDAIKDPDKLPIVHGHLIDENMGLKTRNISRRMTSFLFKYLATIPEDNFARHPLFIDLYQKSVQKRFETAEFLNQKTFTREEFAKIQYDLEKAARADAMKGVKATLYNVERRTNAAHMLRFISPFFSAQENAIKTWFKIATEKPVILSRANIIYNAPNRLGLITDPETGEPVEPGVNLGAYDTMWLEVPDAVKKLPIIGKGLSSLDQIGISKRSLDVIFQGNPFGVSVGPLAAIPVSNILKAKPELSEILGFAFPYGPDASIKQFLPTWMRRGTELLQGLNDADYAKTYQLIWITEQHKARDEGRPYLTDKEVQDKTKAYYSMRVAANLILPFAPQFQSPYRFYMDKWKEYSKTYGINADAKFLQDYPDYFDFATTLSKNPTNSQATMNDVENAKRYSGLIGEIASDNASLVGLVTKGSGAAKFSPTAYWWQSETSISAGTPERFRGRQDPKEAQAQNQARKGWAQYRQAMVVIDAHLAQRGLTSLSQSGAEDLAAAKQLVIQSLASEIDPVSGKSTGTPSAWYQDYKDLDGTKTIRTIDGFRKIITDDKFMADNGDDPTWKSVAVYLKIRDGLAATLRNRPSNNIDAQENADLRNILDYYVNQLKIGDVEFATIYDRFLSQDKVYDKYLGIGI